MREQSHFGDVLVRDVVGWLTTVGHPNSDIMQFVNQYLEDGVRWQNEAHGYPGYYTQVDLDGCWLLELSFGTIQLGMQKLNALLYEIMRDRNPDKEIPADVFLLFSIIKGFYSYGGEFVTYQVYKHYVRIGKKFALISSPSVLKNKEEVYKEVCRKRWFQRNEYERAFNRLWTFIVTLRKAMVALAAEPIFVFDNV